jgi:hypothetical protein
MNSGNEYSPQYSPSVSNTFTTEGSTDESLFSNKNGIIIFLLVLVILSFLGINLLTASGNALEYLAQIFGPKVIQIASMFGYSAGNLVNTTADVTADTAKLGVDIAEGTAKSVGNLLIKASHKGLDDSIKQNLEKSISSPKYNESGTPLPSQTADPIHRQISAKKGNWCFIGDDAGTRGCISINDHDKCMSGQIFPSKEACMNTST